jgi:hypothetical protein
MIPQPARFWDYLLGGNDNYPIDRKVGEQVLMIFPDLRDAARAAEVSWFGPSGPGGRGGDPDGAGSCACPATSTPEGATDYLAADVRDPTESARTCLDARLHAACRAHAAGLG